jgi:IMP cyclohydrolase
VLTIAAALESRSYPGRGLIAARTQAGARCLVYFLTGRSPSSRARRLAVLGQGDVAVQGAEPGGQFDPLRHYAAAARRGSWVVVGNGAQVVPIAESLAGGGDLLAAWRQHSYEPDGPIFTPRIWVATIAGTTEFLIGYALRAGRDGGTDRVVWSIDDLPPGRGVLMSTYDGTPERVHNARVPINLETDSETAAELLDEVFSALAPDLRVAAFALDPDRAGAGIETRP